MLSALLACALLLTSNGEAQPATTDAVAVPDAVPDADPGAGTDGAEVGSSQRALPPAPSLREGGKSPEEEWRPKPWIATTASVFFPGGGFLYLRKPERTAAYASVEAVELAALVGTVVTSGYDSEDPSTEDRFNRVLLPGVWLQNTHFVGIYDAYRTARLMRGPEGYRTPVPRPGLEGLARAPFRGRQLLRPEIGLPLGALAAAGLTFSLLYDGEVTFYESQRLPLFSRDVDRWTAAAAGEAYYVTTFYAVGIGEEALFRGVLQTQMEEALGTRWGWIATSVFFGSLHALASPDDWRSALAAATVTGTVGGYLGWLYQRDDYDLSAGIFVHVWYDVIIGTTLFLADPEHQPFSAGLSIPF